MNPPSTVHLIYPQVQEHDCDDCSEITNPAITGINPCYVYSGMSHPPRNEQQRELLDLKLQILKQQEKISTLNSRLEDCERENEALEEEKAVLVEELALANNNITKNKVANNNTSPTMIIEGDHNDNTVAAAEMKVLQEANAKLTTENSSLQVIANVMRKSFRQSSNKDKELIKSLKQEILLLKSRREHQEEVGEEVHEHQDVVNSAQDNDVDNDDDASRAGPAAPRETFLSKSSATATTIPLDESAGTTRRSYHFDPSQEVDDHLFSIESSFPMQEVHVVGPKKNSPQEEDNDHGDDNNNMLRLWKGTTPPPPEKNDTNTMMKNGIRNNNGNRAGGLNWLRWSKRTIVPC